MNTVKIVISAKSVFLVIAFLILSWITYQSKDVILLLFASFIIASALIPSVDWLSKKMPRMLAVVFIYTLGFIILSTMLIPLLVVLIQQARELISSIPVYVSTIEGLATKWQIVSKNSDILPSLPQVLSYSSNFGQNILSQSINITINAFEGLVGIFTGAVMIFFILLDKEELKKGLLSLFHQEKREQASTIMKTISLRVGGYVRGQLLVMILVGILTTIGLLIVGVDFAILLGLLAAIFEIVPIIGPFISAIPAIIITLTQNPWMVPWTILVYFIVQRIENSFLTPLTFGKFLDMHPIIIIMAILIAASTLGVVGVILSPAIAAAVYILVQELYVKRINPELQDKDVVKQIQQ